MHAFQLTNHGDPGAYALQEIPDPHPGVGEVVVQVNACGLNHLDLWLEKGALPVPVRLPRTPGGEVAGTVAALGSDVTGWSPGDRVAVQSNITCGECEFCRQEEESQCLNAQLLGVQRDGGLAERLLVPARALTKLPDGLPFTTSAALTLAGSTAMHMLTDRAQVKPGDWVLVMAGASGVGSAAIQIARQLGARVISTGSTETKRELARSLGAEVVVDLKEKDWVLEVRRASGRRGVDCVVEHLGGEVLPKAFQCLARGGTVVTCGATMGKDITFDLWPFFVKQQRLVGSYGRNRADLVATLAWAAEGRLQPVIDSVFSLDKAAEGIAKLRSRAALGKVLIESGRLS